MNYLASATVRKPVKTHAKTRSRNTNQLFYPADSHAKTWSWANDSLPLGARCAGCFRPLCFGGCCWLVTFWSICNDSIRANAHGYFATFETISPQSESLSVGFVGSSISDFFGSKGYELRKTYPRAPKVKASRPRVPKSKQSIAILEIQVMGMCPRSIHAYELPPPALVNLLTTQCGTSARHCSMTWVRLSWC